MHHHVLCQGSVVSHMVRLFGGSGAMSKSTERQENLISTNKSFKISYDDTKMCNMFFHCELCEVPQSLFRNLAPIVFGICHCAMK